MVWDWGWNWQQIDVNGGSIAFNISGVGGDTGQGTGSVSIIDTIISGTTIGILTNGLGTSPNIVLDNTVFDGVESPVVVEGGATLLSGSSDLWATGTRYNGSVGSAQTGAVTGAPTKAAGLLNSQTGFLFVQEKPQYETLGVDSFRVATTDGGCANDGAGDQTACINTFLQAALAAGQIAYFPAGIYLIGGTVLIPTGSRLQGSSWSQIQGAGFFFSDMTNPQVMVQVGNKGEVGSMEIVEMLFSVQGNTAGAILMEWNVAAESQGSAAMWDSHLRVGGGEGTDLDMATCPKFSDNSQCIAASLLLHVTPQANGYFENVWAWVADHDNDFSLYDQFDPTISQTSIFSARGMLIESQGPSWFVGSSCEHSVLYNYQLSDAKDIYMGHIQTESPYFQPVPAAPAPFAAAASFPNDPDFSSCNLTASSDNEQCRYAWGLRVVDSNGVIIHSAGLYSFFNDFYQDCDGTNNCQERILEVTGSTGVIIYNLFTVATVQIANGIDSSMVLQAANQRGFTTEVSVWLPLPGGDNVEIVWVGTDIWSTPTVTCSTVPCLLVIPTSSLSSDTTISPSSYTTPLVYGGFKTTTIGGIGTTVFVTTITTVTISIPTIVTGGIPYSNVNVSSTGPTPITIIPSVNIPPIGVPLPDGSGGTTTRTVTLPPWPQVNGGPTAVPVTDPGAQSGTNTGSLSSSTTYFTGITSVVSATGATVTTVTFPGSIVPITISCPAETSIVFSTPAIAVATTCTQTGTEAFTFSCPTTDVFTFLASTEAAVSVDCTLVTAWSTGEDVATSTSGALVVYGTDWPPYGSIVPVTTTISSPKPSTSGVVVPCIAWFFFICISYGEIHIGAWYWVLPPGIYGPGPPPIGLIEWPPGFEIEGNLPDWPEITIGNDNQITTEEEPECETETAEVCSFTTIVTVSATTTETVSSASFCETISGCSISGVSSTITSTEIVGTQTIAPIWTWDPDAWPTADLGDAYTSSVWAMLSAELAAAEYSQMGTTISFTSGPTAGPTCAGASTACGGTLCSGYWCTPTPTGYPPGYLPPNDPNSLGYTATITTVSTPNSSTPPTSTCPANPTCNCNEDGCDACSPACCDDGTCSSSTPTSLSPTSTTSSPTSTPTCDCTECGSPFEPDCCQSDCEALLQGVTSLAQGANTTRVVRRDHETLSASLESLYDPRATAHGPDV